MSDTTLRTPEISGGLSVQVGQSSFSTEFALAVVAFIALGFLWLVNFTLPKP